MADMIGHLLLAFTTFAVTNIDDLLLLTFYFAGRRYNVFSVVVGQYAGISVLIIISLSAIIFNTLIPDRWISLMGILPILIGLRELASHKQEDTLSERSERRIRWAIPQVAAVTIANGGDNIGVYVPLFAKTPEDIIPIYIMCFLFLTGIWCYLGYYFVSHERLKLKVHDVGTKMFPYFLIGLGLFILSDFFK